MNKERNRRPGGATGGQAAMAGGVAPAPEAQSSPRRSATPREELYYSVATHSTPAQTGNGNLPQRQAGAIEDDHSFLPGPESRLPHRGRATESDANLRHKNGCVNSTKHIISMPYPYYAKCRLTACKGMYITSVNTISLGCRNRARRPGASATAFGPPASPTRQPVAYPSTRPTPEVPALLFLPPLRHQGFGRAVCWPLSDLDAIVASPATAGIEARG